MQNHKTASHDVQAAIKVADKILLIAHQNPDGDCLGSVLAMYRYIASLDKDVTVFCNHLLPSNFSFLPNTDKLTNDHTVFTQKYDLVITVDTAVLHLTGIEELLKIIPSKYKFINIDHHVSNAKYGDINLIISSASSTAEIIYRLLQDWQVVIDEQTATALACGLITDTGGFKNPATTYTCLEIASDLINQGANIPKIIKNTVNDTNITRLQLWGRALERLTKVDKNNLVYTWLTLKDLEECQADGNASEGISNFLHILNEGKIIMVLQETDNNIIKGSLRTTSNIDLSKLAAMMGGGGHQKAAGFSLPGRLEYVNNKLKIV
jgi:bifunctional oligoribonuclease and PAP phosphatase NrnA